jgi:cytochrome oxidase assembly protein ShyY1
LLVNRGWIKASLNRDILPDVKSIESIQKYKGTLYKRLKGGISLDDGIRSPKSWPVRLGSIDIERAKDIFESPSFFKYQLRLDQGSVGALDASWETVSVKPSKHYGYAVQWFVMSFVLLVMTFVANSNVIAWVTSRFMK